MTADLLLPDAVDKTDFPGTLYVHPSAGDAVHALYLHDAHVAFYLYASPEPQCLSIGMTHFMVQNCMIIADFCIGFQNQAINCLLRNLRLIGLYGKVFVSLMDCHGTYRIHGEKKTREHVLGGVHDHEPVPVVPIELQSKDRTFLHGGILLENQHGASVIGLACIEDFKRSQISPVAGLAAAFGVEDGPVRQNLRCLVRMSDFQNRALQFPEVCILVVKLVHIHGLYYLSFAGETTMARIKSAWEIALEKTQDIEIDEAKYRTDKLTKEGMALAGGYLNNTDQKADELAARYAAYSEEDRALVRSGMVGTILSNVSLPSDDIYQMRFDRTRDLVNLVTSGDPQADDLMHQIGDFLKQYLDAKSAFVDRMKAQIQQAMENNPEGVNTAQYSQIINQNLKKMEGQYSEALENTKAALRELLGA